MLFLHVLKIIACLNLRCYICIFGKFWIHYFRLPSWRWQSSCLLGVCWTWFYRFLRFPLQITYFNNFLKFFNRFTWVLNFICLDCAQLFEWFPMIWIAIILINAHRWFHFHLMLLRFNLSILSIHILFLTFPRILTQITSITLNFLLHDNSLVIFFEFVVINQSIHLMLFLRHHLVYMAVEVRNLI